MILTLLLDIEFLLTTGIEVCFHLTLLCSHSWINSLDLNLFSWTRSSKSRTCVSLTLTLRTLSLLVLCLWFHFFFYICILDEILLVFFSQFFTKLWILFGNLRYSRSSRNHRTPWFFGSISSTSIGSFPLNRLRLIRNWRDIRLRNFLKIWVKLGHFLASIGILRHSDIVNVLNNISVHIITSQLGSTNSLIYLSFVHWSLPIIGCLIALFYLC